MSKILQSSTSYQNSDAEMRKYALNSLALHLKNANYWEDLHKLLTTYSYLQEKLSVLGIYELLNDFETNRETILPDVCNALHLSSHILVNDHKQLASQIVGRLLSSKDPLITSLLDQAKSWMGIPWLRPLTPSLAQASGPMHASLEGHLKWIHRLYITSDDQRLISWDGDDVIIVWKLGSGQRMRREFFSSLDISFLSTIPKSHTAIIGSKTGKISLWDFDYEEEPKNIATYDSEFIYALSPDGQYILCLDTINKNMKIRNLETAQEKIIYNGDIKEKISKAIFSPDGSCVLLGFFSGKITIINITNHNRIKTWNYNKIVEREKCSVVSLAISPNGNFVGATFYNGYGEQSVRIWDFRSGEILNVIKDAGKVIFTPDNRYFVVNSGEIINIWSIDRNEQICSFSGHNDPITSFVITQNGQNLISGAHDKTIKIWDLAKALNPNSNI